MLLVVVVAAVFVVCDGFTFSSHNRFVNRLLTMNNDNELEKVTIIGGGFGGLYTALKVAKQANNSIDVTLIDNKDQLVLLLQKNIPIMQQKLLDAMKQSLSL